MQSGESPAGTSERPPADEQPHKNRTTKGERQAIRIATMNRWQPGQSGNPLGGASRKAKAWETFRQYMEGRSDFSDTGDSNFIAILRAATLTAIMGDSRAQESLIELYLQSQQMDKLKLAEHFRAVAADSVNLALKVLGEQRMRELPPEKVAEALKAFCIDAQAFLREAEDYSARASGGQQSLSSAPIDRDKAGMDEDQSSPKSCDMASYDPSSRASSPIDGSAAPIEQPQATEEPKL